MDKALLMCLCIFMLIGVGIMGLTTFSSQAQAPTGVIVIENADYVSTNTTEYSADLINIAENVTPRIVVEYGEFISPLDLYKSDALNRATSTVTPRIIVEYADSIFEHVLESVIVPDITPRIKVEYADSIFSTNLERPTFEVTPNIRVTSPNGGESWLIGRYQPIQWTSFGLTGNVKIELSTDGGSTWKETFFANIANDGVEDWRVMAYSGNQLRIRVASIENPAVSDISDNDFSITTISTTNTFPEGYCTWWAYERRAQLGMPVEWLNNVPQEEYPRHAHKWINFAEDAGIQTGSEPRQGAIAVWGATATNSFGHVAIVEGVETSSLFGVSEMNFGSFVDPAEGITVNFRKVTDRTLTLPRPPEENFLGFIYEAAPPPTENQPPVADAGLDRSVFSGDFVTFNASNSYDPDGTIVSYRWDFGDGATAEGKIVSHRFRGMQNEPKIYTVSLTVEDDDDAARSDTVYVTVAPLQKTVEVSKSSAVAKMTVTYNWIDESNGEDIYIISKIHVEAKGFVGTFVPTVWVWEYQYPLGEVPTIDFLDYLFIGGRRTEKTYEPPFPTKPVIGISPSIAKRTFNEGTFEGIQVKGTDVMSIYMQGFIAKLGWPPIDVELFEFNSTSLDPHAPASEPSLLQQLLDKLLDKLAELLMGQLGSAGELRVYDADGRVTGLVNGVVKEEIPNSAYINNTVIMLSQGGSYRYEIVGIEDGSYGLLVASFKNASSTTFTATDISISTNATHQYTINWTALSQGQKGVTVQVDLDGDGTIEKTFTSDNELTRDEFMSQVHPVEAFPLWIVGVAVAIIAIATMAIAVFWRKRKQPPTKV